MSMIPENLLKTLTDLKPILERQGSVHFESSTGRWRLRYRDPATGSQKTIALGDDERVAAAVTELIEPWRTARKAEEKQKDRAKKDVLNLQRILNACTPKGAVNSLSSHWTLEILRDAGILKNGGDVDLSSNACRAQYGK